MRAQFVASEVGNGLRRNLTMTLAVIITVAVSLTLFGVSLLVRAQVDTMKDFWYDKVEVSIFLCAKGSDTPSCAGGAVTPAQRDQIKGGLLDVSICMLHVAFASLCAGHTASVRSLTFTSDSHQLLTASDDRTIRVYVPHSALAVLRSGCRGTRNSCTP